MSDLPAAGLANTITGFATLFSGLACLALSRLVRPQPARWQLVYWMIALTGVFTVTLHGFGETNPVFGAPWFWTFLDTGSNIVVAWSIALAVLGDYYDEPLRWRVGVAVTLVAAVGLLWHFQDSLPGTDRRHLVPLGGWGGFYPGESVLIALSFTVVALFVLRRDRIPAAARPLLLLVTALFFVGMLLATASNEKVVFPFLALHALWHLVGAFGFVGLWAFNHVRFSDPQPRPLAPCALR